MLIDTTKCIGCYTCRLACQRQNGLEPDEAFVRFEDRETGTYPQVGVEHVPLQCMHCEDAPCTKVCPTGAAHIGTDGIVQVDHKGPLHRLLVLHGSVPVSGSCAQL